MKKWKFLLFLPAFFICLLISAGMGPAENPVLFYQPVFFAGTYILLGMFIRHDIEALRGLQEEDKNEEMPFLSRSLMPKQFNVVSFSRFILQARLLGASIGMIAIFSDFYIAFRNLFYYLLK